MAAHKYHAEAFLNNEGCATVSGSNFRFEIDHPAVRGGKIEDVRGMPPVEAFIGSVASCHLLVMRLAEKAQKMKLVDVRIKCVAEVDHAASYPGISSLDIEYVVKAQNTKEEVEAFVEKTKKECTLLSTLAKLSGVKITDRLTIVG